jgi:hypothetical protein
MTQVTTATDNYAAMAQQMGMSTAMPSSEKKKSSNLPRLRIHHNPLMGEMEVKDKMVKVEVVDGGTYKLEVPEDQTYYATSAIIRPFLQRFMYKRFIMGTDNSPNRYVKTVMANDLNSDMKDNDGGFNCGKPSGWIEDFAALPDTMKDLIRSIKRARVLLGTVELVDPVDEDGNSVTLSPSPFIWEIENRDAFKTVGGIFTQLSKMRHLPPQHNFIATTEKRELPNGNCFYLPKVQLDASKTIDISDSESQETLANFLAWISNYNEYILGAWDENKHKNDDVDEDLVDSFVDIDADEFV